MTFPRLPDRDANQVEALVADRYLDALLEAVERRPVPVPGDAAHDIADDLDPGVRDAARVLRRALVRVHPSFRFEERLAARLAGLAAGPAPALAPALARAGGTVIPFPAGHRVAPDAPLDADPLLDAILRGDLDPADEAAVDRAAQVPLGRRPLIVGGAAITSAAISIVGVAIVAWRASRPGGRGAPGLMSRAARTAHARRAAALGIDLLGPA